MTRKVVWVTGAGKGLGRALALAFAKRGYRVAVHFNTSEKEASETAREAEKAGTETLLLKADLRSSKEAVRLAAEIQKKWGRIDVLVNNAGSVRNRTLAKMSDEEWRDVMSTCLDVPFFTTRAVLPVMRGAKGGSILNIVSYLALRPARGAGNYSAAKAGLVSLTQTTALEEGRNNIRANALLPGFHVTDMNKDVWAKMESDIRAQHLLPDLPNRDDMAAFAVTVAELKSVTGQVFAFESRIV